MNCIKFDVMPIGIKSFIRIRKKVCIFAEFFSILWVIAMVATGLIRNLSDCVAFFVALQIVMMIMVTPWIFYCKLSQSILIFLEDHLNVCYENGKCWRTIKYSEITDVRVKEVPGFFYGENQNMEKNNYICIFLNGTTDIPDNSFAKLFKEENFFMFAFQEQALLELEAAIKRQSKDGDNQGTVL
ncbi:MAG: hypothetical protein E7557_06360 [Ruminococcaceae bacterium]|nr:hypothetical protein [Oscillospiraceae bacterium]